MGYRSNLAIWLPEEAQALLTDELKTSLSEDWNKHKNNVWTANNSKWYSDYPEVKMWENFLKQLSSNDIKYDFIRIGEDNDDVEIHTCNKFWVDRFIAW